MVELAPMASMISHANVSKDSLENAAKSTTTNANLSPVETEEPVQTKLTTSNVNVSLATLENVVKTTKTIVNQTRA